MICNLLVVNNLAIGLSGINGEAYCYYADDQYIKENGQTVVSDDLSALAPPEVEIKNLWRDFRKVAEYIKGNREWLLPLLGYKSTEGIE